MSKVSAQRYNNLKAEVKAECARRSNISATSGSTSVASYAGTAYDYTITPASGVIIKEEHYTKNKVPLAAIKSGIGSDSKLIDDSNMTELESFVTLCKAQGKEDKTATNNTCSGGCTGLCYLTCTGSCNGGCQGTCSSSCTGSCTGGCSTGCTGSCKNGCGGACSSSCKEGDCYGGCSGDCQGSCTGDCDGSCKGGCDGCSGYCGAACESYCSSDGCFKSGCTNCNNSSSGGCSKCDITCAPTCTSPNYSSGWT